MPETSSKESAAEILAPFSWFESRRLRRTPRQLDLRLRVLFLLQWVGFLVLLGASLVVLVRFGPTFAREHPILLAIVVLVAAGRHAWGLYGLLGGEAVGFAAADDGLRGGLTQEDADEVVQRVGERLGRKEVPNIFIAIDKEANALAANSTLFNSIPRYNAVFLNSFLFKALRRDELQAVLAHELAHFHRYIGPLGRNAWLGVVGSVAACVALFAADPEIADIPLLIPLVVWWSPIPFIWVFNKIASTGQHALEHACDAIAAEIVGAEAMANALLKMGDRLEVLELVERELRRHLDENSRASPGETVRTLLDRIPEEPVSLAEARRSLRLGPLPERKREDGKRKTILAQLLRNRKLRKALDVVPWSGFDVIHRDGRLDREELRSYVKSLARSRNASTHEIAAEHPKQESEQTHPATRKRIVYLYLHFLAG